MGGGSWVLRWGVSRPSSPFQEGIKQTASLDGMVFFKRHSLMVPKIVVAGLGTQALAAPTRKNLLQEVSLSTQESCGPASRKVLIQYRNMRRNPTTEVATQDMPVTLNCGSTKSQTLKSNRKFHVHLTSAPLKDPYFAPERARTPLESPAESQDHPLRISFQYQAWWCRTRSSGPSLPGPSPHP